MGSFAERFPFRIQSAEDIRPAAEQMRDAGLALGGFRVIACDNIASKQPMTDASGAVLAEAVFGWTGEAERWWTRAQLALVSPVTRACRYESEPFWGNTKGLYSRQPNPYLAEIDLTDFEKRALCRAGIVVPVHLPFGQIGGVSFHPSDEREDLADIYEAYADDLMVLAHRFIAGYAKTQRRYRALPGNCQLTKREVECLRWAAVGKTDQEISIILTRSHATIRFHIRNAAEKLNTVNRSQTIFKAAQLGYIDSPA